jgi:hypothetical protein
MNYKKMKIEELKSICKTNSLSTTGKKEELVKRISDWEYNKENLLAYNNTAEDITNNNLVEEPKEISSPLFRKNTQCIHLNASNLPFYFNCGVIYPLALEESEIYRTENRKRDIFTQIPEYIILSQKPINSFQDDDVLVEIITDGLSVKDITGLALSYLSEPIPLSRIKHIWFKNTNAKNSFLSSIKAFPDSFVHESLCEVLSANIKPEAIDFSTIDLPYNIELNEWRVVLKKFDKVMGMFSFMKNAGVFFAEKENHYQEYTQNYFSALSIINTNLKISSPGGNRDSGLYRFILFPHEIEVSNVQRVLFRRLSDTIHNELDIDLTHAISIIQEALVSNLATPEEAKELNVILDYFVKLSRHQIAYKDLLLIEVIRKNYPVLALLFLSRFSNKSRQHTDKQAVRNTFILHEALFNKSTSEYLLAMLGLYYGYKTMIKEDTNLRLTDSYFSVLTTQQQSIKFKFATTLDRVTVESIFNFCRFGKSVANDYSFLNIPTPYNQLAFSASKYGSFDYTDHSFDAFNTRVTSIERRSKANRFLDLIEKSYPDKVSYRSPLLHFLISTFGVEKKVLLDLLKANMNQLNPEELAQVIDLEQRQRNNRK